MSIPEWLFGPAGDLRPLPSPEMDVVNTVQRFGGVHNAINGARTVDVLGHRANYEFALEYLEPEEYFRLEALYTETIPGPFWLVDPVRKNLLSREAALAKPADASGRGLVPGNSSVGSWVRVTDGPLSWNQRAFKWENIAVYSTGADLKFDEKTRFPVLDTVPTTVSVYVNPTDALSLGFSLYSFDSEGNDLTPLHQPYTAVPAGVWTRHSYAFDSTTLPAGAVEAFADVWYEPDSGATSTTSILMLNPQIEHATAPTDASFGGGAARVVIETLDTTSPRYPYQTVALSMLEV